MAWVKIPDFSKGVNFDGMPEEIDAGVTVAGKNMRYRFGYAERFHGFQDAFTTPSITPYHIAHYTCGSNLYVVYSGLEQTFVDDGTTRTEITNGLNTGSINDRWCGFSFNGLYVQNNGVDVPQYWPGIGTLANVPAWPAGYKAGFMRPYKYFLVAGDITRGGVRERSTFLWSTSADPGSMPATWDIADATQDAGDVPLAETNGTLIDAMPLGDVLAIYKDDAIHYAQAVDTSDIFRFGRMPGDTGLLARGCVVNTPLGHVLLTPALDLVINNGQGLQSIINGRMRTWLNNNINKNQAVRSFLCVNPRSTEVLCCFPEGSSTACTKAIVWNWTDNTVAVRELANATYGSAGPISIAGAYTWATLTGTWDTQPVSGWSDYTGTSDLSRLVLAHTTPTLSLFDSTELDHGSPYTAQIDLTGLSFGAPEQVKLCRGVRPQIDATAGTVVSIQIGASMTPDAAPTWQSAVNFTVGTDLKADCFASGRYLALRLSTSGSSSWRLRSAQMDIVAQGAW